MAYVYFILFLFFFFALVIVVLIPLISSLGVYQQNYQEKISQYECGFEASEKDLIQFEVRYYLIGILFLLFDLEIAFLLPYLIVFSYLTIFGVVSMVIFFFFLVLGFYYEWVMGGLEWD